MSLAGHVARMGKWKMYTKCWQAILKVRDNLGDLGIDGPLLNWISKKGVFGVD
jgi:hypothetical protein